jgi:predicted SAM-dependent methyltransferase
MGGRMNFKYLNIGGGNFSRREEGWANLDYPFEKYQNKRDFGNIDIPFNLMEDVPLPIEDNSIEAAYSEHTIEHLTDQAVARLFKEVYRILMPGGAFKVVAPNADKFYESITGKSKELISSYAPTKGITDEKELFFEWLFYHLIDKFSPKTWRTILTWSKEEFFKDVDKCISWYPIDLETQKANCNRHISWWNHEKTRTFLKEAGFNFISEPLGPQQSTKKILRQPYLDKTGTGFSFYIEAIK